jgi:uncharacterized protein (DUF58 family)
MNSLVYPAPDFHFPIPVLTGEGEEIGAISVVGQEEFAGFKRYKETDAAGHVDWKGYARTGELNTKLFEEPVGSQITLSLAQATGNSLEEKLSVLTGWCLQCEQSHQPFGLSLPGNELSADIGRQHVKHCLEILSLYENGSSSNERERVPDAF